MFIQTLKPLNDTAYQETPGAPERSKTTLIYTAAIRTCKAEGTAERETYSSYEIPGAYVPPMGR